MPRKQPAPGSPRQVPGTSRQRLKGVVGLSLGLERKAGQQSAQAVQSQSSTSSTTLSSGGVGRNRSHVLDSADSQAGSSQGSQSGLTTRTRGLGLGTTGSSQLDVDSGDADLFAFLSNVLGSQHGGVWGGLVSVGLDLHTTSDSGDGLLTGEIGHVDEGVVEGSIDAGNTENLGAVSNRSWMLVRFGR